MSTRRTVCRRDRVILRCLSFCGSTSDTIVPPARTRSCERPVDAASQWIILFMRDLSRCHLWHGFVEEWGHLRRVPVSLLLGSGSCAPIFGFRFADVSPLWLMRSPGFLKQSRKSPVRCPRDPAVWRDRAGNGAELGWTTTNEAKFRVLPLMQDVRSWSPSTGRQHARAGTGPSSVGPTTLRGELQAERSSTRTPSKARCGRWARPTSRSTTPARRRTFRSSAPSHRPPGLLLCRASRSAAAAELRRERDARVLGTERATTAAA